MADKILFDEELYHVSEAELPCLITYREKTGGSHFSVTLAADLFLQGSKILFLTAYPMAKDNFLEQLSGRESEISYVTSTDQLDPKAQVIILESGNEELYLKTIALLDDLEERVVLIKNLEVFSEAVFSSCLNLKRLILSGDIDKCAYQNRLKEISYQTIIAFSKPLLALPFEVPILEKYVGYYWQNDKSGLTKISK